jgi:hypothetical protein
MNSQYEIKTSKHAYDMSSWCSEKSEHVVSDISKIISFIKNREDLPKGIKEELDFYLSSVLWDATKLLAFSCDGEWSVEDSRVILEMGYEGFEKIAIRYNLLEETAESKNQKSITLMLTKLNDYLCGERAPNRTYINELLDHCRIKDEVFISLSSLTNKVNMGEIDWIEYTDKAKDIIRGRIKR